MGRADKECICDWFQILKRLRGRCLSNSVYYCGNDEKVCSSIPAALYIKKKSLLQKKDF